MDTPEIPEVAYNFISNTADRAINLEKMPLTIDWAKMLASSLSGARLHRVSYSYWNGDWNSSLRTMTQQQVSKKRSTTKNSLERVGEKAKEGEKSLGGDTMSAADADVDGDDGRDCDEVEETSEINFGNICFYMFEDFVSITSWTSINSLS